MRNFLIFFIIVFASCSTSKQKYNPNVTYIIAQTPIYDLYVSKKDIVDYMNGKKTRKKFTNADYDCINKYKENVTFRIGGKEKAYTLESSDFDKVEIADIFNCCAIDLFKYKKVLVYDRHQMEWIDYKTKYIKNVIIDEDYSYYLVTSKKDKREIFVYP